MSYNPPKRGAAYVFSVTLTDQANTKLFKSNPTLAAGDVKVSKDNGALANITTLPTVSPGSSVVVLVSLSATEMTADNIEVIFSDAAGAEWCDLHINIQPASNTIDEIYSLLTTIAGYVDTETSASAIRTALGLASANLDTQLSTIAGYVDTETGAAAIRAALGIATANMDTQLAALALIKAKTDQLVFTVANEIDANILSVAGSATALAKLKAALDGLITGAAVTGTLSTTQASTNLTSSDADYIKDRLVTWTSGALVNQQAQITAYNGTTKVITFTQLTAAPSNGDTFVIQ